MLFRRKNRLKWQKTNFNMKIFKQQVYGKYFFLIFV